MFYGPRTVTENLVLCLDAGNPKSYPGSGTIWTDLSGNMNNGTLAITIARQTTGTVYFNGKVSIVRVYNRALTESEIQQNYNANKSRYL